MLAGFIRKELKKSFKERGNIFFLFIMPMLFIAGFGLFFGNTNNFNEKIYYIDQDKSAASQAFLHIVRQVDGFSLVKGTNLQTSIANVKSGKSDDLLVIPKGFGEKSSKNPPATLNFYYDGAKEQSVAPVLTMFQSIIRGEQTGNIETALHETRLSAKEIKTIMMPPVMIVEHQQIATGTNPVTLVVSGYTVMFVFYIMITMLRGFVKSRESGMFARLSSTPMNKTQFLLGMWIPNMILAFIQTAVMLIFGHFVFQVHLGNPLTMFVFLVVLSIAATGLGLVISFLAKTESAGIGVIQVFTLMGAMLSGLMMPLYLLPSAIQKIAHFLPQYWAQTGMTDIMTHNATIAQVWQPLLVLVGFALVCLIVARLTYSRYLIGAKN